MVAVAVQKRGREWMLKLFAPVALVMALSLPGVTQAQSGLGLADLSEADRAALHDEIRAYLLENPEVIFEAIQILEERRQVAGEEADAQLIAQYAEAIFEDGYSFVGGNPNGDVTLVEFLDYRCGFCKRAHPEIKELLERDPEVRLVVKEFPILGPDSVKAGRIALAALDIDSSKYASLSDELMEFRGNLTEQAALRIAGNLGYEIAELKERAESTEIDDRIARNYQLAQVLNVQGTPAFIVGDQIIRGYLPVDDMVEVVNEARAALN